MTTETLRRPVGRESALMQQRDDFRDEAAALRLEARDHARTCLPSAKRLLDSAIRDGRFHDFQDAALLNANLERLRRRHER